MGKNVYNPMGLSVKFFIFLFFWIFVAATVFAEIEIDLDSVAKPSASPAAKPVPTSLPVHSSVPLPTAVPTKAASTVVEAQSTSRPFVEMKEAAALPVSAPLIVQGTLKMKDIYDAGIRSYKALDYDQAIRYLTEAVKKIDPYTPKYYYAEAYATLGIIYQFHIIHYQKAYDYYNLALRYERNNRTAKKHLKEVAKKIQGES